MKVYYYFILLLVFISCSKNEFLDTSINNTYIEFQNPTIIQTISFTQKDSFKLAIPIQIFGEKLSKESTIIISIINGSGNAKKNIHFTFDSIKTIKSNTYIDTLFLVIATQKITAGTNYSTTIEIKSESSNIQISKNSKICSVTFHKESFIDFFKGNYSCYESNTNSTYDVTFEKVNDSIVKNLNFWDFPNEGETVPYIFHENNQQTIEIPRTDWIDKTGNTYTIYGTGIYNLLGNFEVDFFIEDSRGEIYQSGKHIFTKE